MSKIKIKRATATIDLVTDLELAAEHEAADAELARLQSSTRPDRLTGDPELKAAAARVQEIEQRMAGTIVQVTVQALNRVDYAAIEERHAPREDNANDKDLGVNTSTFFDEVLPKSILSAKWKDSGKAAEGVLDVLDEVSDAQYSEFVAAVLRVNRGRASVPFSRVASVVTRD